MTEAQLSVRSTRARDLAHKIAAVEHRSVTEVVELALETYARAKIDEPCSENAAAFYERLNRDAATSVDIEEIIQAARTPHSAISL